MRSGGSGVYRTDNVNAATPTRTKLTTGLPAAGMSRIAVALTPSNHDAVFALIADSLVDFARPKGVYGSTDGGDTWSTITTSLTIQGSYTLDIAVDVRTEPHPNEPRKGVTTDAVYRRAR